MIDVAIVGASGYGGGELLRLLGGHPKARVKVAVSETYAEIRFRLRLRGWRSGRT